MRHLLLFLFSSLSSLSILAKNIVPPIIVKNDHEVISNVKIISHGSPAILVNGHIGVVINNVIIEHQGSAGIEFNNAKNISIRDVEITNTGSLHAGSNNSATEVNIKGSNSMNPSIDGAVLRNGSSGIYLIDSTNADLSNIIGYNMRGPYPRGQLVQLNRSDNARLKNFYSYSNPDIAWTEDNISVYNSINSFIKNGLIDGNNGESGSGIMIEQDDGRLSNSLVEDVDIINSANLAFAAYPGNTVIFRRTRVKNTICTGQGGRPAPKSGGLLYASADGASDVRIIDSKYFNVCRPEYLIWQPDPILLLDLTEEDFIAGHSLSIKLAKEIGLWNGESIDNYGSNLNGTSSANNGNLRIASNRDSNSCIGAYITELPANINVDILINRLNSEGTWRLNKYTTDVKTNGLYKTATNSKGHILLENCSGGRFDFFQADIRVLNTESYIKPNKP